MRTSIFLGIALLIVTPSLAQSLPLTYPSHYLAITPTDSTEYGSMYSDQATRDSIRSGYSNAHRAAKAIEQYALEQQSPDFLKRVEIDGGRDRWEVALANGDTTRLNPRVVSRSSADLTFEHYHPTHNIVVFRSQWVEGNGHVLVSRVDRASIRTFGPSVFSPSGKWFITYNEDTVAGYSPNGVQVFKSKDDPEEGDFDFEKVLSYRMEIVGPTRCKWIDESTFRTEVVQRLPSPLEHDHYRVAIRKPSH